MHTPSPRASTRKPPAASRIKLLVVSEPGVAGVKRHVCDLLRHIDTAAFDVHFVYSLTRADQTYRSEIAGFVKRGIACSEIPMRREISPVHDARAFGSLAAVIRRFQPDIIHAHSSKAGFLSRAARVVTRSPAVTIYTPHAMPCYFSTCFRYLEKLAACWTDWIVAVSPSEAEDIASWNLLPEAQIQTVTLGVDADQFPVPGPPRENVEWVGACGRICRQKNAALFFQAGELLLSRYPQLRLKWIGDWTSDEEAVTVRRLLARSSYRDRIHITGWVHDVAQEMQSLDIFCMLSRYESFGYVTADAMVMGIPVVGIPRSGTRDLVTDRTTGLLAGGDAVSIAAAVDEMMHHASLRQRLAKQAYEFITASHHVEARLNELYDFYHSVVPACRGKDDTRDASAMATSNGHHAVSV